MNSSNSGLQEWEKDFTPRVIKAKDWEPQRENFTRLYFTDKYNLNDVRRIMAKDYRFYARPKQCKAAIAKWGLGKNLKRIKMLKMLRIQDDRKLAGKSTVFRFKGQRVKKETLKRGRKRYNGTGEAPEWYKLQPPVSTPSDVDYSTPRSSNSSDDSSSGSEGGAPSPIVYSKPSSPRENSIGGASPDQLSSIGDLEYSPTMFLWVNQIVQKRREQESAKRPNDSGNYSGSDQKPALPTKSLDTLSDLPTTCDITHELLEFPARAAWLESSEPKSEAARTLCLDCLMGGFTIHGTLSAESILFEAFGDISPSQNSDYQISSSCTSSFCPARFRINHPETHYFSTSLFVEQVRPVYV
ncbi:uncharacterized protein LAJ45_00596 [Morchella importuna]|uniref:uncharacterized protein n=1 Tax=Morchella importuna TaxID=1174673 RepID=UPI001E8EC1C0|nr:uncharacterized protein LAJ45_00596 [Morchella importuna]KAH8155586.1 hypothetical protein LAJ45_00596 [Morchella importuna]